MPLHRPMELIEVEAFLEPEIRIESVDHERVAMVFVGRARAYIPPYHILARLSRPRHAAVRPLDKRSISGMTRSFGNILIGSRGTACNPVNPSEPAHRGRVVVDEGPCQRNRVLGDPSIENGNEWMLLPSFLKDSSENFPNRSGRYPPSKGIVMSISLPPFAFPLIHRAFPQSAFRGMGIMLKTIGVNQHWLDHHYPRTGAGAERRSRVSHRHLGNLCENQGEHAL